MKLSVVIPAYNERTTIGPCLLRVIAALPAVEKEILVVDDCSTDGTGEWLQQCLPDGPVRDCEAFLDEHGALQFRLGGASRVEIRLLRHPRNRGKGGALQTGLAAATGEVVVIQDADLEYDPADWADMYRLIAEERLADVVYGSRFMGRPRRSLRFHHYFANQVISLFFSLVYDQALGDVETCYKMFSREVLRSLRITADDFGFEIQLSAQIVRARRWRVYEAPIAYYGRTHAEGKKINWKDGLKALWYVIRYRVG